MLILYIILAILQACNLFNCQSWYSIIATFLPLTFVVISPILLDDSFLEQKLQSFKNRSAPLTQLLFSSYKWEVWKEIPRYQVSKAV